MSFMLKLQGSAVAVALLCGMLSPATASAASASQIREAQSILTKFTIPTGPIDGIWGAQTAQGVCAFRHIAGMPVSRGQLTTADMAKLRGFNAAYRSLGSIPAPKRNGYATYLVAHKTCQTMVYVTGGKHVKVFRISTGKVGYDTPNKNMVLGAVQPGWSCSTLYPESCYIQSQGINAKTTTKNVLYSKFGNMYNKRVYSGAYLLHGSLSVPTYPASHGCIRTTIADSDWMYNNIPRGSGSVYMSVIGTY